MTMILHNNKQELVEKQLFLEQTVNAAPALMTNLEEENAQNTSDIDQESLLQSEEMMRAFMKATGGVEDESNKKERTKTIIKTIKVSISCTNGKKLR